MRPLGTGPRGGLSDVKANPRGSYELGAGASYSRWDSQLQETHRPR